MKTINSHKELLKYRQNIKYEIVGHMCLMILTILIYSFPLNIFNIIRQNIQPPIEVLFSAFMFILSFIMLNIYLSNLNKLVFSLYVCELDKITLRKYLKKCRPKKVKRNLTFIFSLIIIATICIFMGLILRYVLIKEVASSFFRVPVPLGFVVVFFNGIAIIRNIILTASFAGCKIRYFKDVRVNDFLYNFVSTYQIVLYVLIFALLLFMKVSTFF